MTSSDRIQQKKEQIAKMSADEGRKRLEQLEERALADDNFNRALENDRNWEIFESVDDGGLERLMKMADAGNKQAMYDTAAVFTLIGNQLRKQNDNKGSFFAILNANLWVEEAQKV